LGRCSFYALELTVAACLLLLPVPAQAQCPSNLLANPGLEEGEYKTESLGTSLSSALGNGWTPWSILGDATHNREVEYKVLDVATLPSAYHVHSGNHSQKFFTTWGTHTAGFYQRVAVAPGSRVIFTIWVQIYTGERELESDGNFISDLNWPTESNPSQGPGLYSVYAGIDPYGDVPAGFGAPPSANTVWTEPINEFDTRIITDSGSQVDQWVQLSVSTIAQANHVTVYTKGQPEFPVKHNDSFWDDACLMAEAPPTATPRPTNTSSPTPIATDTPIPTDTPLPTETPEPTLTLEPSATPTVLPISPTRVPTEIPTPDPPAPTANEGSSPAGATSPLATRASRASAIGGVDDLGPLLIYGGVVLLAIVAVAWMRFAQRR